MILTNCQSTSEKVTLVETTPEYVEEAVKIVKAIPKVDDCEQMKPDEITREEWVEMDALERTQWLGAAEYHYEKCGK